MVIAMTDIQLVRFFLGGIEESELPDVVINMFLTRYSELEQPLKIFNTCISCLQWLVAQATAKGETYTSRTESISDEEISIKGISKVQAWSNLLKYLLEHPDFIDPSLDSLKHLIVIGGVKKSDYYKIKADPNGRDWTDETSPYHKNNCITDFNYK